MEHLHGAAKAENHVYLMTNEGLWLEKEPLNGTDKNEIHLYYIM